MAAVVNSDAAFELYNWAKQMPGTSTKSEIQHQANICLNGPVNVDLYGPKIIPGIFLTHTELFYSISNPVTQN